MPVKAEFFMIPAWEYKKIGDETYACYDFEAAKELKLVDVTCYENTTKLKLLNEKLTIAYQSIDKLKGTIEDLDAVISSQKQMIQDISEERDKYILQYHRARSRDIIGGGFPWLIATGAVLFAGGLGLGYYFARR